MFAGFLKKLSISKRVFLYMFCLLSLFVLYTGVIWFAFNENRLTLENSRDKYFPSLENLDKAIFFTQKLRETFQAAVSLSDEDELQYAKEAYDIVSDAFKIASSRNENISDEIAQLQTTFEKYFQGSFTLAREIIVDGAELGEKSSEIDELTKSILDFDNRLKDLRQRSYLTYKDSIEKSNKIISNSQYGSLFLLILCLLITIVIYLLIRATIVKPIIKIADASQLVADGNLVPVHATTNHDELGVLNANFNNMVESIKRNFERMDLIQKESMEISASLSLPDLMTKISKSFSKIAQGLKLKLFVEEATWLQKSLESGYYLVHQDGSPQNDSHMQASEISSLNGVKIFDPRTNKMIGFVKITNDVFPSQEDLVVFNVFATSIANALAALKLESAKTLIDRQSAELRAIFKSIPQGICTFGEDFKIGPQYSSFMHQLFGDRRIHDMDIRDLVVDHLDLDREIKSNIASIILTSCGEDLIAFEANAGLLPRQAYFKNDDNGYYFELEWSPIVDSNDVIEKFILIIRDITLIKQLEEKAKETVEENEKILQLINIASNQIESVFQSFDELWADLQSILGGEMTSANQSVLKRIVHTIKGNARAFGLKDISVTAHMLEEDMAGIKSGSDLLKINWELLKGKIENYNRIYKQKIKTRSKNVGEFEIIEKVTDILTVLEQFAVQTEAPKNCLNMLHDSKNYFNLLREGVWSFPRYLELIHSNCLNKVTNKFKKLHIDKSFDFHLLSKESVNMINNIFSHLFTNSVCHSDVQYNELEIYIEFKKETEDFIEIGYKDSGNGLKLGVLRRKNTDRNILYDDLKVAELIFLEGQSTAETVNLDSGRGVGMAAVSSFISSQGGRISIEFLDKNVGSELRKFQFIMEIPKKLFIFHQFVFS